MSSTYQLVGTTHYTLMVSRLLRDLQSLTLYIKSLGGLTPPYVLFIHHKLDNHRDDYVTLQYTFHVYQL